MKTEQDDLVQIARLAISGKHDDVRLFMARMVRRYRTENPGLADELDHILRSHSTRSSSALRKKDSLQTGLPADEESRLLLLKTHMDGPDFSTPLFSGNSKAMLDQLIKERHQHKKLKSHGLLPARSAIFLGKPGVGKTLSARWVAAQLGLPLYILDLTAVMSSLLGKTGINLRAAIDFAKQRPCVLLLDEIDAIAKRRSDDSDIGELKRLVTVILQEVESWPDTGLLLAATNYPELIDPALWRRFDLLVEFDMPDSALVKTAVIKFLDTDYSSFEKWIEILVHAFTGDSYSDIERTLNRLRRALALEVGDDRQLIEDFIKLKTLDLDRQSKKELAILMTEKTELSQHAISQITGVSRDTIRKHAANK